MFYLIHTIEHNDTDLHNYGLLKLDIDAESQNTGADAFVESHQDTHKIYNFFRDIDKKILLKDTDYHKSENYTDLLKFHCSDKIKVSKEYESEYYGKCTIEFTKLGKTTPIIKNFKSKIVNRNLYDMIMYTEIDVVTIEHISKVVKYNTDNKIESLDSVVVKSRDGLHFTFTDNKVEYLPKKDGELLKIKLTKDDDFIMHTTGWDLELDSFINAQEFALSVDKWRQAIFEGVWYKNIKSGEIYEVSTMNTGLKDINGKEVVIVRNDSDESIVLTVNEFHEYFTMA